ncbi:MAG: DUF2163 domain-containing protein [Rickettsiales bacterium]|jgi:uncharacterized phage protein (TIGR02218 family)|nr:DUF2163 domain-containing protein [Rickettsiales bacterium]
MKQISSALAAHIAGEVTTLATCWKLKRRDNVILGFTDLDRDITFETVLYKAATGFTPTAIESTANLSVDNLDVEGMISAASITEADIQAGRYDFAEIEIFKVNYLDLSQGALKLRRGWLGEVSLHKQHFVAEIRGLTQLLSQNIGELYSPSCRASFGDTRCKVNLAAHTVSGSITSLVSNQEFRDTARTEPSGIFSFGVITFTSGANQGLSIEVKEYVLSGGSGKITCALPMPFNLLAGDSYQLIKGCDKTAKTCHERYDNIINYRGEPSVPGIDKMLETAGTKSSW